MVKMSNTGKKHFNFGYCKVKIFTHAIKGLAESDFILAAKIDKIN